MKKFAKLEIFSQGHPQEIKRSNEIQESQVFCAGGAVNPRPRKAVYTELQIPSLHMGLVLQQYSNRASCRLFTLRGYEYIPCTLYCIWTRYTVTCTKPLVCPVSFKCSLILFFFRLKIKHISRCTDCSFIFVLCVDTDKKIHQKILYMKKRDF
jgi:hypothetical protein